MVLHPKTYVAMIPRKKIQELKYAEDRNLS